MNKEIMEILRGWKISLSKNDDPRNSDIFKDINPMFEDYFLKHKTDIYKKSLILFQSLDVKNLKKVYRKETLSYASLNYFDLFIRKNPSVMFKAIWTEELALDACKFAITRENKAWIEIICSRFRVTEVPKVKLIALVKNATANELFSSAAYFSYYANLLQDVKAVDFCIQLICQNKLSLAETMMRKEKMLALDVIQFLDNCVDTLAPLTELNIPNSNYNIVNTKSIRKLSKRLARDYGVSGELCPRINHQANISALKFLVRRKYVECKSMDRQTWETMVDSALDPDDKELLNEFIYDLTVNEEYEEAKFWANRYQIQKKDWPEALKQSHLNTQEGSSSPPPPSPAKELLEWSPEPPPEYMSICLAKDKIIFINDHEKFKRCITTIYNRYPLFAFDTEWKPNLGLLHEPETRSALVQIAIRDSVFIIDALTLRHSPLWADFVENLMNNPYILKIGFASHNDIKAIQGLLPQLKIEPVNLLDYGDFYNWLTTNVDVELPYFPSYATGLSKLTYALLGKQLAKGEQYTNWEIRPLEQEKIHYAAIDAHVLMEIHEKFSRWCDEKSLNCAMLLSMYMRGKKTPFPVIELNPKQREYMNVECNPTPLKAFKVVCDAGLTSLGTLLRTYGVDVIIPTFSSYETISGLVKRDQRIFVTLEATYNRYKDVLDGGFVFPVPQRAPIFEKLIALIIRYKLIMSDEYIYSRCIRCNHHHIKETEANVMKNWQRSNEQIYDGLHLAYHNLPQNETVIKKFYFCPGCGEIYWKGKYYELVKGWARTIMLQDTSHANHGHTEAQYRSMLKKSR